MNKPYRTGYDFTRLAPAYNEAVPVFHRPRGNRKLGNIAAWNIAPVLTCSACACRTCACDGCYAVKNMFCHGYDYHKNNVIRAWMDNTKLVKTDLPTFVEKMDAFLTRYEKRHTMFRIHSSGDFFSVEYARAWFDLAAKHPRIQFLAFTKQWDCVRPVPFYTLDNFALVPSGWTGCEIPEDLRALYRCAYCVEKGQTPPAGARRCPGDCSTCGECWHLRWNGYDIYFDKH